MSIIEELKSKKSLEEIFTTIHRNNLSLSEEEVKELQDHIIKLDQRGKWCILLAEKFPDKVDLKKIEDAVINKDKTGQFCYILAKNIPNVDKKRLKEAVEQKDKTGVWKLKFNKDIKL
jgi:hypothetical protein